jgi:integrase
MMNVGDVEIDSDGKVTITLQDSKTLPRKVPLPENPKMLIRWLEYHPFKDNKNAPLFPSGHNYKYAKRMVTVSINYKFKSIKNHTGIKNSLTPHCFRKSRATIMFSSRNPFFDDSEIAKFFGWKSHTVIDRRQQYDLRDFDDLKKKIQGNIPRVETYDTIKQERDNLEKDLKEQVNKLTRLVQLIAERTGFDFDVDYLPATLKDMDNNPEYYLTEQELKNP